MGRKRLRDEIQVKHFGRVWGFGLFVHISAGFRRCKDERVDVKEFVLE